MDAYTVDGVQRLEELGVTDVIVGFRWTYDKAQDTEPSRPRSTTSTATPTPCSD